MALIETTRAGRPLYRVRWNYRREHGKKKWDERSFRDKQSAVRFQREVSVGHTQATENITVGQLAERWFSLHVNTPACQLRTRKDYESNYRLRIKPTLDSRAVSQLTPRTLGDWRDWMVSLPTGARSVNKTIDTLKTMIRWGRSEGLCTNQMIDDFRRVKTPRPKPANPYPPDVVEQIANGSEYLREATLIRLAAYAGLRWSELRALHWNDIDLDAGTIDLTRSIDLDHSSKSTKSDRHRIVPVLAPGVEALKLWRRVGPDHTLVFPSSTGKPLRENGWYGKRLPKIREACGIHFDLHELRDTYASILIQSGIGEAELTLWLGHRSIQTTRDRYAKLFDRRKATLVSKANDALKHL